MADVSALYPQPPKPPDQSGGIANVLTNPANVLQLMQGMNALQASTQQLRARNAIGEIYRKNIKPDGTLDEHAAIRDIANNPDTAYSAPEAVGGMLQRQGQALQNQGAAIANHTSVIEQQKKVQDFAAGSTALLNPNAPDPAEGVHNWVAMMKRNNPSVPSAVWNSYGQAALSDPQGVAHGIRVLQTLMLGPAVADRIPGPPDPVTGAPTTISRGEAHTTSGAMVTDLPSGERDVQKASAERGAALQGTASTSSQYHADLDTLKQLSKTLDIGGPTVEFEKKFGQLAGRLGLPATITPDQLKAAEEFDKTVNMIGLNQSKQFVSSDSGLATVMGANPSLSMSKYGREGAIDLLQGRQDAVDKARELWLDQRSKGVPAHQHDQFMNDLSKKMDARVFIFNRMSRENQQKFWKDLDDHEGFKEKYNYALKQGWVSPPKKDSN